MPGPGPGNSDLLPTHANLRAAGNARSGLCRAWRIGRSRGTTWPARYLAPGVAGPSRTNNGSFVVRALNNFQGGGYLVPGAYINVLVPRTGSHLPRARHCRPLYPRAHGDVFAKKTALRQKKRSFTPLAPPVGLRPQREFLSLNKIKYSFIIPR